MSGRQVRQDGSARQRKRGKGKAALTRRIITQATAWKEGDVIDIEEIGIDDPLFDEAFRQAEPEIETVLGEGFQEFVEDLANEAMTVHREVTTADGRELLAVSQMFFVPVHGSSLAIEGLLANDADFGWVARSFRECGVAMRESNIRIVRGLVRPLAAVEMTAGNIRKAAMRLARSTLTTDGAIDTSDDAEIMETLGGSTVEVAVSPDRAVDCLIVGVRTMVVDSSFEYEDWPTDYLTYFSPDIAGEPEDDTDDFHDPKGPEVEGWIDAVAGRLHGTAYPDPPQDWTQSIRSMAYNRLMGAINFEKAALRIDLDTPIDRTHVHHDAERILVAAEIGKHILGPIDIPIPMAIVDSGGPIDDIASLAPEVIEHDDASTLLGILAGTAQQNGLH
jgi:hypothetical protein